MQQIALPPLYGPSDRSVPTVPFPLVRRRDRDETRRRRKFFAGLLFGVLMSGTLVLLGYEARVMWETNPELRAKASGWLR